MTMVDNFEYYEKVAITPTVTHSPDSLTVLHQSRIFERYGMWYLFQAAILKGYKHLFSIQIAREGNLGTCRNIDTDFQIRLWKSKLIIKSTEIQTYHVFHSIRFSYRYTINL